MIGLDRRNDEIDAEADRVAVFHGKGPDEPGRAGAVFVEVNIAYQRGSGKALFQGLRRGKFRMTAAFRILLNMEFGAFYFLKEHSAGVGARILMVDIES